jgi:hypothetical protein
MALVVLMSDRLRGPQVEADIAVRVPRGREYDLEGGVEAVVERVVGVAGVDAVVVTGVTPRLNAVRTDATVRLRLAPDDAVPETAGETLESGFGVETRDIRTGCGLGTRPDRVESARTGPGLEA